MAAMHSPRGSYPLAQHQYRNEVPQHHHRDLPSSRAVCHSSVLSHQHSCGCLKFGTKSPQVQSCHPDQRFRRSEALPRVGGAIGLARTATERSLTLIDTAHRTLIAGAPTADAAHGCRVRTGSAGSPAHVAAICLADAWHPSRHHQENHRLTRTESHWGRCLDLRTTPVS
jgi:hypothetical protein